MDVHKRARYALLTLSHAEAQRSELAGECAKRADTAMSEQATAQCPSVKKKSRRRLPPWFPPARIQTGLGKS
eukprot:14717450-Alexandrium_andersonii.AAC.1